MEFFQLGVVCINTTLEVIKIAIEKIEILIYFETVVMLHKKSNLPVFEGFCKLRSTNSRSSTSEALRAHMRENTATAI